MLPNGLTLDEVQVSGTGISFNWDPLAIGVDQPADVLVRVSAASIARFLNKMAPAGLTNCQVHVSKGHVLVEGIKQMLIPIKASIVCRLVIVDQVKLNIELVEADVFGSDIKGLVQQNLASVNPVLDCSTLPLTARLNSVEMEGNWVTLKAHLEPLQAPEPLQNC